MYRVIIIASVVLTLFPVVGYMQKKELDEEAYRSWRRVDDYQLSDHGGWIKYDTYSMIMIRLMPLLVIRIIFMK